MLHLHPAKHGKFLEILTRKEEKRMKNFSKKNFKFFLPVRKNFSTFAPALRNKRNEKRRTRS
ncbi:hypothetical protein B0A62_15300, partial [Flavobacterium hydatis]